MLIPKQEKPASPGHFRPIRLCNDIYKILTKILANRLQQFLPKLISPERVAFVRGRSITDNCMLVQEILHSIEGSRLNNKLMAVKLDMQKAYDTMELELY